MLCARNDACHEVALRKDFIQTGFYMFALEALFLYLSIDTFIPVRFHDEYSLLLLSMIVYEIENVGRCMV